MTHLTDLFLWLVISINTFWGENAQWNGNKWVGISVKKVCNDLELIHKNCTTTISPNFYESFCVITLLFAILQPMFKISWDFQVPYIIVHMFFALLSWWHIMNNIYEHIIFCIFAWENVGMRIWNRRIKASCISVWW